MAEQHSMTADYVNRWKFTGHELDRETGLYYAGARYYDPKVSIWLSVDPLAEKYPNWNTYAYTFQNPINFIDPDGREGRAVLDDFLIDPPKKISDYNYNTLEKNYTTNGQKILEKKGSALGYLANQSPKTNTCAIRMSDAFNLSGY